MSVLLMITTEEGTPNLIAWNAFDTDREEEPKTLEKENDCDG